MRSLLSSLPPRPGPVLGVIASRGRVTPTRAAGSDARPKPVRHKGFAFTIRHSQITPTSLPLYPTILTPTLLAPQ